MEQCPKCDGHLAYVEGTGYTGVVSPDGARETRWEQYYECSRCYGVFSVEDIDDDSRY